MSRSLISQFVTEDHAAIGPLYAIGISVLVVMSAIGFDYGRLMALDSELQNAADQAALAAATQLDGGDDAMTRARDSATNAFASAGSTFTNQTRFANDRLGRPITDLTFEFYADYLDDSPVTLLTNDADGADAKVVQVTVNARRVFYALTPLVGAISSGDVIGKAMAGQQSATCNVAPMFFCVPQDGTGANVLDFPRPEDVGRQIRLHVRNSNAETVTPGNFGFLDQPFGANNEKNRRLGLNTALAGCFEDSADETTDPGHRTPQGKALNSRLDLFESPIQPNNCDADGDFCPSENTTKNWVIRVQRNRNASATCPATPPNNSTWINVSTITDAISPISNPGFPDDSAFTGILGNGNWTAANWISSRYSGSKTIADVPDVNGDGNISRYETYLWQLSDSTNLLQPKVVGQTSPDRNGRFNVYCAYPKPVQAAGLPANDDQKDRRILTAAAVACTDGYPNGSKPIRALRWVDLFITKPMNTASDTEFYTEVIGPATRADGGTGFQYFGRKKAVLIR